MVMNYVKVFSRLTECYLFLPVNDRHRARCKKYILITLIMYFSIIRFAYAYTLDDNDVSGHIRFGNMFVTLVRYLDLFSLSGVLMFIQFAMLETLNMYFVVRKGDDVRDIISCM